MTNANRALAAPWSIGADHTDSLSQRDTGWLQFYCESCQESLDTIIQAYKIAETISLPVMINLEGFILTHTSEPVYIPEQNEVQNYLPPFHPDFKLDVDFPMAFSGGIVGPTADHYMNFRSKLQNSMEEALDVARDADDEFKTLFGRHYGIFDEYYVDDAEIVVVSAGTISSTARVVVKELRTKGIKVGALKIRMFRPFPVAEFIQVLGNVKKIAVLDRNVSSGSGGVLAQEIRASLYLSKTRPEVFGFLVGLGGKDVTPKVISDIVTDTMSHEKVEKSYEWIGLLE
jgi:pyruvate/2-oxoacid:ferredoxin oxidoreductase alpha subunit